VELVQLEKSEIAIELFACDLACFAPVSGNVCDLSALIALTAVGDIIALVSSDCGGYPFDIESFNRKTAHLPFDASEWTLDYSKLNEFYNEVSPKLTIVGASAILHSYSIKEIVENIDSKDYVVYDGSHILGLIAGGKFQDPLHEGIPILFGSTHKTFPGPQGGIILGTDAEIYSKIVHQFSIQSSDHPFGKHHGTILVDNVHSNRIAALGFCILEMLEFGPQYAEQVIKNSKSLGTALNKLGLPVKMNSDKEITQSHQVILKMDSNTGLAIKKLLETCGINIDAFIRIGTSEVTRRGYKERDMEKIAKLIHRVMVEKEDPISIRTEVEELTSLHSGLEYCFTDIDDALEM
jgi:glycine hydroxymethyltransferase